MEILENEQKSSDDCICGRFQEFNLFYEKMQKLSET